MRKNKMFFVSLLIIVAITVFMGIANKIPKETPSAFNIKVEQLDDKQNWYYEIYSGEKLMIKQQYIPGANGRQFFKNKDEAAKVAFLVIEKIKSGLAPTVNIKELEELNIPFN